MLCREIMKRNVVCLGFRETVQSAARRMSQANHQLWPVCDDEGRLIGTLSPRDIAVRCVAEGGGPAMQIMSVMTRDVVCCHPEQDIVRAHQLLVARGESILLCCENDGRVVGVVGLSDVAACLGGLSPTVRELRGVRGV